MIADARRRRLMSILDLLQRLKAPEKDLFDPRVLLIELGRQLGVRVPLRPLRPGICPSCGRRVETRKKDGQPRYVRHAKTKKTRRLCPASGGVDWSAR